MRSALPSRLGARNFAHAIAAPAAYHVLATRPIGADCCETILRGDFEGTPAQARRHALLMLDSLALRHPAVDVQLLGLDNAPMFIVSAGGDS